VDAMITHFQYKPLYKHSQIPGWSFSFYSKRQKYTGIYHQDGKIEWTSTIPTKDEEELLTSQIHELMLFHVYDK
jgi:Family of unknown function (DUF5342)